MITQSLSTTTDVQQQTVSATTNTSTALVSPLTTTGSAIPNTTVQNKTVKSSGQDRLVCSLCNKVYRSSAGLRYHKRKRHRGNGKRNNKKRKSSTCIYKYI